MLFRLVLIGLLTSSCSTLHSAARSVVGATPASGDHASGKVPSEAPSAYKTSVDDLEAGKFEDALKGFDQFIQQNAASPWSQAAMLNSGRALEGQKKWEAAAERYRNVVRATANAPRLRAMGLYRLSACHEALGDDPQVVADLNDLLNRTSSLPPEIAQAELPARLAAAYSRVGNFERAQEFYRRAESGIAKLRQSAGQQVPEWLPRTLFLMGESSRRHLSWNDFESALRPLARNQVYLLQAAEIGLDPWAERAAQELDSVYQAMITTIEGAPIPEGDALLAKRTVQQRQWERAALLADSLTELKARFAPNSKTPAIAKIEKTLNAVDKRLSRLFGERPAGEGLTAASLERRRKGLPLKPLPTSVATDTTLEEQFLKSSRESLPVESKVPRAEMPAVPVAPVQPSQILTPVDEHAPIRALPQNSTTEDPNL